MVDLEAVAKRLDRRDGYRVVAYREVGLPLFRLSCSLTLQETSGLGAIEEFVLRAIAQGVDSTSGLEQFLGLPSKIVASQLGQLLFEHLITQCPSPDVRYELTPAGVRYLEGATSSKLIRQQMPLYVDGITRKLVPVDPNELWSNKQLDDIGVSFVTPTPARAPRAMDIDVGDINRVVALMARVDRANQRVIRLDAIVGRPSLVFRRSIAIAFKSTDGKRIAVGFAIDGRQSDDHEIDYERSGVAARTVLFGALFDADKRRKEIQIVARELRKDMGVVAPVEKEPRNRPTLTLKKTDQSHSVPTAKIRVISVYEHPPLLRRALESADRRVVIVSPWIRANVVDNAFIKLIGNCLARGVEVTIGYGIGKKDLAEKEADRKAREALEALTKTFNRFRLVRKGNTHAKVLLVDDAYFVTTSFNWLSFKGDRNQPMREEEGTIVEDPAAVEAYYQKLLGRMLLA